MYVFHSNTHEMILKSLSFISRLTCLFRQRAVDNQYICLAALHTPLVFHVNSNPVMLELKNVRYGWTTRNPSPFKGKSLFPFYKCLTVNKLTITYSRYWGTLREDVGRPSVQYVGHFLLLFRVILNVNQRDWQTLSPGLRPVSSVLLEETRWLYCQCFRFTPSCSNSQ